MTPHIPAHIDEFLATYSPESGRQQSFDQVASAFGGYDAAVEYLQPCIDAAASGVIFAPERPPHNAIVKQATVGPFTILYHSAYPPHLQHRASFAWNFYIGRHGEGQNSIMQPEEWSRRGIRVDIIGYTGKWENCTLLKVAPATRVRFTYPTSTTVAQEEVVFPRNPREASIPIQYLE